MFKVLHMYHLDAILTTTLKKEVRFIAGGESVDAERARACTCLWPASGFMVVARLEAQQALAWPLWSHASQWPSPCCVSENSTCWFNNAHYKNHRTSWVILKNCSTLAVFSKRFGFGTVMLICVISFYHSLALFLLKMAIGTTCVATSIKRGI